MKPNFWIIRILSVVGAIVGCVLLDSLVTKSIGEYQQRLVFFAGIYVTLAVSLNLINGITGQFSIGHAAFYQVGAYAAGYVAIHFMGKGVPPQAMLVTMMILGACFAGLAGLVVGLPSLRLKGDYLAIVTLGFGEIIRIIVQNTPQLGGAYALDHIPKVKPIIWLALLLAVITIAVSRNLIKTARGLTFLAVREDEIASSAMGVNVTRVKVTAFVLGSMFAGAAGALLAHYEGVLVPQTFSMDVSFVILTMVVLGGTGSITGTALSAIFLSVLPEYLRNLNAVKMSGVLAALLAIIAVVVVSKRIVDGLRASNLQRGGAIAGVVVGGVILQIVLAAVLKNVPWLQATVEGNQLRMPIFSLTLIILMLFRPTGVFGHHEFSWDWVRKVMGRSDYKEQEVAA